MHWPRGVLKVGHLFSTSAAKYGSVFFFATLFLEARWVMSPDTPVLCCFAKRMAHSPTDGSLWQCTDELVCVDAEDIVGVHLSIPIGNAFRLLSPEY